MVLATITSMTMFASLLALMTRLAMDGPVPDDPMRAVHWLSFGIGHLARTLPAADRTIDTPLHPALRVAYHRCLLGEGALSGGLSLQAGFQQFDRLFWSLSSGAGLEGAYRSSRGLFSSLGLRLEYARAFTGRNHFVLTDGQFVQRADPGRGFLRLTVADLTVGFAPSPLRRRGVVPAVHYAWMIEAPAYAQQGASLSSYTTFGVSVLWMWEAAR
jgi:hypothetical protein